MNWADSHNSPDGGHGGGEVQPQQLHGVGQLVQVERGAAGGQGEHGEVQPHRHHAQIPVLAVVHALNQYSESQTPNT